MITTDDKIDYLRERLDKLEKHALDNKTVFNVTEVSEFLGLAKSTVYKLTMSKKIPHYKKLKHLYFIRTEIENWVKDTDALDR